MAEIIETIERVTSESAAMRGAITGTAVGFFVVGAITVAIALNRCTRTRAGLGVVQPPTRGEHLSYGNGTSWRPAGTSRWVWVLAGIAPSPFGIRMKST